MVRRTGRVQVNRLAITRADFQRVAVMRIEEAQALLDAGKWDGAYYLAGYSIELALKACIIKKFDANRCLSRAELLPAVLQA